jgi:hypothetical protein
MNILLNYSVSLTRLVRVVEDHEVAVSEPPKVVGPELLRKSKVVGPELLHVSLIKEL